MGTNSNNRYDYNYSEDELKNVNRILFYSNDISLEVDNKHIFKTDDINLVESRLKFGIDIYNILNRVVNCNYMYFGNSYIKNTITLNNLEQIQTEDLFYMCQLRLPNLKRVNDRSFEWKKQL